MSEIRRDRLHNQYVLIAPERLHRPDFNQSEPQVHPKHYRCPFCEGNEAMTPSEIFAIRDNEANAPHWKTRVIPNLFKAVQIELEDVSRRRGMCESIPGVGAHEIIIDSPFHDMGIESFEPHAIELWLRTIIRRIEDLRHDQRLIYLSIFKNVGAHAGATQEHPHTQLLALPIMPRNEMVFLERNMDYYRRHGRGKLQDIVENEHHNKDRVIEELGNFIAYCPYASSFPFEVIIAPLRNISTLDGCSRDEISDLSRIMTRVFKKMRTQLGNFDYNLYFRMAPMNQSFENEAYIPYLHKNYRFALRIMPRIYRFGGFEISTGMYINPVAPEECAALLNSKART